MTPNAMNMNEHGPEQETIIEREIVEAERDIVHATDDLMNAEQKLQEAEEGLKELRDNGKKACVTIVVEGIPHEWNAESISCAEVVTLEVPDCSKHPEVTYAVTYKKGPKENPEGILLKDHSVRVKEGMYFNVSETGQS